MMRNLFAALLLILVLAPCAVAYGVTFYNPAWNPQDGMIFETVDPDTPFTFNVKTDEIAITKITFTINREAKNAGVTVYNLRATPDFLPEVPENDSYEFNELKYSGFVPHDTTKFVYEFRVAKGWLENMSVARDTVALHSYDRVLEIWETLPTKIINEDASNVVYTAEQDQGVHYLFIGKAQSGETAEALIELEEEPEEAEAPAEEVADIGVPSDITAVDLTKKPTPAQPAAPAPEPAPAETVEDEDGFSFVVTLAIILIVIAILILYVVFGKKKGRYSVDKELSSYIDESLKRGKSKEDIKTRLLEVGWHHKGCC
jgi:PGF-pre-PGF domain-containing protein